MAVFYLFSFIFGANIKGVGNEISLKYFVSNVCSSFSIFIYACCECLNVGVTLVTGN